MLFPEKINIRVTIGKQTRTKKFNEFYIGKDKNVLFTISIINKNDQPIPKGSILRSAIPSYGLDFVKTVGGSRNIKLRDDNTIKINDEIPPNCEYHIQILLTPEKPMSSIPYQPELYVPPLNTSIYGEKITLVVHDPNEFPTSLEDYTAILNVPTELPINKAVNKALLDLNILDELEENIDKLVPVNLSVQGLSLKNTAQPSLADIVDALQKESPKITIITGPELSGKTTLAGAILIHKYTQAKNSQKCIVLAASMTDNNSCKPLTKVITDKYNEGYADSTKQKFFTISGIADHCQEEGKLIDIVLDLDFWFCDNAIDKLIEFFEIINGYENIRLMLILKEETLHDLLLKNDDLKNYLDNAPIIKILPFIKEQVINIISERSNTTIDQKIKEIIRKMVEHDPEHFTRVPYVTTAAEVIKQYKRRKLFSKESRYLHLKIIIEAIHNLFKQTFKHLNSKYVNNVLE
ncbi:MAG: hypothetical protein ACP6IU_12815, partial [Candidatus Asgardarchaeia archaeon]